MLKFFSATVPFPRHSKPLLCLCLYKKPCSLKNHLPLPLLPCPLPKPALAPALPPAPALLPQAPPLPALPQAHKD